MNWMQNIQAVLAVVLSAWGLVALVLGPVVYFKARKYFPERAEAITPNQLREELAQLDYKLREAWSVEMGRIRLSVDEHHREVMTAVRLAHDRANAAMDEALNGVHKGELVEEKVNGLQSRVLDRLDHIEETLRQLRTVRRGDPTA